MKIANFIAKLFGNRDERQTATDPEVPVQTTAPTVRQQSALPHPIMSGDEPKPMPSPQIQTLGGTVPDVPDNLASLPASNLPLGSSDPQNIAPTIAPRPAVEPATIDEVKPRFGSPQLQNLEDEIQRREGKDFSIKKDENGNVIHRGKDRDKDHDAMDILKGLGIGALKGYLSTGNFGGAVGGAIGGGIGSAVDRNYDEKFANDWKLNQTRQKYAQQFQRERQKSDWLFNEEARRRKAEGDLLDNQGKVIKNQTDILEYMQKTNKSLYDSIMADNLVTQDEADKATKAGFPMQPYDARKFNTQDVEGRVYASPELGAPQFKEIKTLPIDRGKVPRDFQIGENPENTLPLTPNQIAPIVSANTERENNRNFQIMLKNAEIENNNIQESNKSRTEKEKLLATRDGALKVYESSNARAFDLEQKITELQNRLNATEAVSGQIVGKGKDAQTVYKPNPAYQAIERQLDDARREYGEVLKTKTEAQKTMTETESLYNRLPAPTMQKTINPSSKSPKKGNKGGKNNNIGSRNDFKKVLDRIK